MPRRCKTCSHPDRKQLELMLVAGNSYEAVSRESRYPNVSPDSLARHWDHHVIPEMKTQVWADGLPVLSLAERLFAMEADASMIRKRAMEAGDDRLALQAIKTSAGLFDLVRDRLGIDPQTSEEYLEHAQYLFTAIITIISETPKAVVLFTDRMPPEAQQLKATLHGIAEASEREKTSSQMGLEVH